MKGYSKLVSGRVAAVALGIAISSTAGALSLDDYLAQVRGGSLGYQGAEQQANSAALQARESSLLFSPTFFAEARTGHDGKPSNPPLLQYDRVNADNYSLGLAQQFDFGLQAKLYYQLQHTQYINSPQLSGAAADFYDAAPVIELSMPLWGNGFGRSTRAQEVLIKESGRAEQLGAKASSQYTLVQAEAAYWDLVVAREAVTIQTRAVQQAQSILDYVTNRNRMNLGERGDILQAKALVEARKLELLQAQGDAKVSLRKLNLYRQAPADETALGNLDPLPYERLKELTLPAQRPGSRYDVEAEGAQVSAVAANAQLIEERVKPTLDLYGQYARNGRGTDAGTATSNTGHNNDTLFVGVKLSVPLNRSATNDVQSGARLKQQAQATLYAQKQLDQERDWADLRQRVDDGRQSLLLAEALKEAQRAKVENERARLKQGRATTYQVLLFEQDFSASELSYVRVAAQVLALEANAKLYVNGPGSEK